MGTGVLFMGKKWLEPGLEGSMWKLNPICIMLHFGTVLVFTLFICRANFGHPNSV
jgi:hypothetical protein